MHVTESSRKLRVRTTPILRIMYIMLNTGLVLPQDIAVANRPWSHLTWIFPRDPAFERKAGRVLDLYHGEWEGKPLSEADCIISFRARSCDAR